MKYLDEDGKEAKLVELITSALNGYFNKKAFCEAMEKEHRYLQSEFMNLLIAWIEYTSKDSYRTDGRNEWVQKVSKIFTATKGW